MEFDQLIGRLNEVRAAAERERFIAAAHQIQAIVDYMVFRNRQFSVREPETWTGETTSPKS